MTSDKTELQSVKVLTNEQVNELCAEVLGWDRSTLTSNDKPLWRDPTGAMQESVPAFSSSIADCCKLMQYAKARETRSTDATTFIYEVRHHYPSPVTLMNFPEASCHEIARLFAIAFGKAVK